MERFTERLENGDAIAVIATYGEPPYPMVTKDFVNRLAEYEDLEEDRRLIRLPCKVGDKVWINYHDFIYESSVSGFFIEKNQIIVEFGCSRPITATYATNFGKTIFLSYEEAENCLLRKREKRTFYI